METIYNATLKRSLKPKKRQNIDLSFRFEDFFFFLKKDNKEKNPGKPNPFIDSVAQKRKSFIILLLPLILPRITILFNIKTVF